MQQKKEYGPNLQAHLSSNPDSLVIVQHIERYAPELLNLLEIGLDAKYKYADPIQKAKSIHYLEIDEKNGQRSMPEVDIDNLKNGIGGECYSITLMTCNEAIQKHGKEIMKHVERHNGHRIDSFSKRSKRNHNFLSIQLGGKRIIFDPPHKKLRWETNKEYIITASFSNFYINTSPDHSPISDGFLDYKKKKAGYKGGRVYILGYVPNTPTFLGLTVSKINNQYFTPIITLYDKEGLNKGFYFLDHNGVEVWTIDKKLSEFRDSIRKTMYDIVHDLKDRNILTFTKYSD